MISNINTHNDKGSGRNGHYMVVVANSNLQSDARAMLISLNQTAMPGEGSCISFWWEKISLSTLYAYCNGIYNIPPSKLSNEKEREIVASFITQINFSQDHDWSMFN